MRKAELTTEQIVVIILLIAAFAIILFVYWQFNWRGTVSKETCHNSVILKASTPTVEGKKVLNLPLRCKTNYICITANSGGKCEKNYQEITNANVDSKVVKSEDDIKKIIASTLYDCWWMMGEGNVDIFSRSYGFSKYGASCVECAEIAFDKSLSKNTQVNGVYYYLVSEKVPGTSLTYMDFLLGSSGNAPYDEAQNLQESQELDAFSFDKTYSIMFVQYARTAAPEFYGSLFGGVVGAAAPEIVGAAADFVVPGSGLVIKNIADWLGTEGRILLGISGGVAGGKLGAFIGGKLGSEYISTWMLLPLSSGRVATSTNLDAVVKFGSPDNGDYCFANLKGNANERYALKQGDLVLNLYNQVKDDKGNWGEWTPPLVTELNKNTLKRIASELYSSCYDLTNLKCTWESYV